jgi:ligand-binding sensor domain-containing protein/signal transduction histidine kinase
VNANSQQNFVFIEQVEDQNQFSRNVIYCILQDSRGFMWFGRKDGLYRYDGYNFVVYKHNPKDTTTISDNWIYTIYEDRSGDLWIGTMDGLNLYNPEKDIFTHYLSDSTRLYSLSNNKIRVIYEDDSGLYWIGTEDGLNRFDREQSVFTHFRHNSKNPNSICNNYIYDIYEDRSGILWIGTQGGLSLFDPEKMKFTNYYHNPYNSNSLNQNLVWTIHEDTSGIFWIGTRNGLDRFDYRKKKFKHYFPDPKDPYGISNNYVLSICEDSYGSLWFGTRNGINKFDRSTGRFTKYLYDPYKLPIMNENVVYSIIEDKCGILWLGTVDGVKKFDRRKQEFRHFDPYPGIELGTNHAIYEESSGILWIGSHNGLIKFDRINNKRKIYQNDPNNPHSLSDNTIAAIYEDRSGVLWIGTSNGGLNKFDRKNERFKNYKNDPLDPFSLSHDFVYTICEDRYGTLWLGTWGGGLNKFDRETGRFIHYNHDPNDPASIGDLRVRVIFEDSYGDLWIGTNHQGLDRFNRKAEKFIHYRHDIYDNTTLSQNRILCINEDLSGILWIGTADGGVNQFNRETDTFVSYSKKDGFLSDRINGILEDNSRNLWMSTERGLIKFNPKTGEFRNYDMQDGIQTLKYKNGAYCKTQKGEIVFGGENGITIFYPDRIIDNIFPPSIVITSFKVFNQERKLEKSIFIAEKIDLSYKDNFISFEFAALDYSVPEKNRYAYKMEGFNKDWIQCGTRRYASYTNLDPGKYIFRVKGSNCDGVWNNKDSALQVIIKPPFWRTNWFYVLCFIVVIGSVYGFVKIRTKNIEKQRNELEKKVSLRTQQLKEEEEKLKNTNAELEHFAYVASHDLQEPLRMVSSYIKLLSRRYKGKLDSEADEFIEYAVDGAIRMQRLIKDLLIFSRIGYKGKSFELTNCNLVLKIVLSNLKIAIEENNAVITYDSMPDVMADEGQFVQLFQNLISNAIKFSGNHNPQIHVGAKKQKSEYVFSVHDNGIGIDPQNMDRIFMIFQRLHSRKEYEGTGIGLAVCKKIIERHKGKIWAESELEKGSTFFFTIPIKDN